MFCFSGRKIAAKHWMNSFFGGFTSSLEQRSLRTHAINCLAFEQMYTTSHTHNINSHSQFGKKNRHGYTTSYRPTPLIKTPLKRTLGLLPSSVFTPEPRKPWNGMDPRRAETSILSPVRSRGRSMITPGAGRTFSPEVIAGLPERTHRSQLPSLDASARQAGPGHLDLSSAGL